MKVTNKTVVDMGKTTNSTVSMQKQLSPQ